MQVMLKMKKIDIGALKKSIRPAIASHQVSAATSTPRSTLSKIILFCGIFFPMRETGYSASFNGWMRSLEQNGQENFAYSLRKAYGNHIEALCTIQEMGLPVIPWVHSPLADFLADPSHLIASLPVVNHDITLVPRNEQEPLYFKRNVTLEGILTFVANRSVNPGAYDIILQESRKALYGGAILSQKDGLLVEMGAGGTSTVLHGEKTVPYRLRKNPDDISCNYSTEDEEIKQLLWQSVLPLYRHRDAQGDFLPGYFEFS